MEPFFFFFKKKRNTCNNSTAQRWEIFTGYTEVKLAGPELKTKFCLDAKNGQYYILFKFDSSDANFSDSPCLTVDSSSAVVIWECNQTPWQQWIFTEEGVLALANLWVRAIAQRGIYESLHQENSNLTYLY